MEKPGRVIWEILGLFTILFHLWLIFSGLTPNLISRPLHMALALPWCLVYKSKNRFQMILGLVFTVLGILCCGFIAFFEAELSEQYGFLSGNLQMIIAVLLLLLVLEMARRSINWPLPAVAVLALAYGLFGEFIPGEFGHPGLPLGSFLGTLTIAEGGLWGKLTGVSVNIVAVFVIFGAVLHAGEAGQGFKNLATATAGRLKGGAAKVSVLSSALFGSISGSASANVASTGSFTLPAMTRLGYPKALAAAVEAVASSGGQIMPPLMGAGAFVMVELTGIPYTGIMAASFFPAVLFFLTVWVGINAFASRMELKSLESEQQPSMRKVWITMIFFAIPFFILLERMLHGQYTPQFSACIAMLAALLLLLWDDTLSLSLSRTSSRLRSVCLNAGKQVSLIASIILCASIIIGVLGQTGLGVKITSTVISASGNLVWPALLLTALACLLLGMEVPTTAAYVICVSVAGPALQELGLSLLITHLFIFWYALLSTITPPVCGTVFIAAGMVEETNWLKVAGYAMSLGVGLYLVPIGMVAQSDIIHLLDKPFDATLAFIQLALSLAAISYGLISSVSLLPRFLLLAAGMTGLLV
ncbi:MAG: TRAP transporter fused permease subunit [SAR324 cluster bacterium]|jgi:TRAP transporter 4TM/12TM fusion protein|nr:TRAP transporter permease DctM/Q [Pseudomonadota bacterium]MBP46243.1 TRAP transporter permease DctM/Q [Deltaproteobacteria bacterium]MDP6092168.1 TRAP transporter fused permease subunit [SAR324 cluster bacterium]MDP6464319.1 TRAP transporter fused permease subunit [SAR324 cluster bacterium]MDP7138770.1 TRAP transporter fused permease subunit [SAR324 cluster bacterium]|tara:strand:- start:710 stop:2470 length:1761 start_codon:yes stop_codon:yes gene_type:complete